MVSKSLQLNGVTRIDRHEMISRVKEAISRGGGYILDFHMFSNASICINFEVPAGNIEKLYSSLTETGLRLSQESHVLLLDCRNLLEKLGEEPKATDVAGTLQITFIHNEPDLRIECPPIPG
jgi:hypothetical protein